jgi:hypothetical protein
MQKLLILPVLFHSFVGFSQYRLDAGISYNLPIADYSESYIVNQNHSKFGFQGTIGLHRTFSAFFSHSFGLGIIQRAYKIDSNNKTILNTSQLYYSTCFSASSKIPLEVVAGISFDKNLYFAELKNGSFDQEWDLRVKDLSLIAFHGFKYSHDISEKIRIYSQLEFALKIADLFQENYFFSTYVDNTTLYDDIRFKIGLQYNLEDKILPLRKQIKVNKKDPVTFKNYHSIALQPVFGINNRIFDAKGVDYSYITNLNPSKYYSVQTKDTRNSNFMGLGINYTFNRFFLTIGITNEKIDESVQYNFLDVKHHKYTQYGITDYYKTIEKFDYSLEKNNFTSAFGIKLFRPTRKFNIIPSARVQVGKTKSYSISNESIYNKRVYHMSNPPIPTATNINWDTTMYISRIEFAEKTIDIMFGSIFQYNISPNFSLNFEFFFIKKSDPILINKHTYYTDRNKYYLSIGSAFTYPLKSFSKKKWKD